VTKRERVERAMALYPDAWLRVRGACQWAAFGFDLDDHAARIVLAAKELRHR
jgi:hypothetical protein